VNHLVVQAFGREIRYLKVLCMADFSRPDHEGLMTEGQFAPVHFTKNYVIEQALFALLNTRLGRLHRGSAALPSQVNHEWRHFEGHLFPL
jgi:hypothetical protein